MCESIDSYRYVCVKCSVLYCIALHCIILILITTTTTTGTLDEVPNLKLLVAHAGAAMPALIGKCRI